MHELTSNVTVATNINPLMLKDEYIQLLTDWLRNYYLEDPSKSQCTESNTGYAIASKCQRIRRNNYSNSSLSDRVHYN
jgi:hypothetical protein